MDWMDKFRKPSFICWKTEEILPSKIEESQNIQMIAARKQLINSESTKNKCFKKGRWEKDEHERFLKACFEFREDWENVK